MSLQFDYAILYVPSVRDAIAFYEKAFGFTNSFIHESGAYGELRTGATRLAFTAHALAAQVVPFKYLAVEAAKPRVGAEFTLTTPDVDAAWARAVAAGAEDLAAPHDMPWGQRVAYVADCHGFAIGIATPMPPGGV